MVETDYVSHELAKRLKEHGFPQDQFPQMVWISREIRPPLNLRQLEWHQEWLVNPPMNTTGHWSTWYAAPTGFRALEWLEEERNIWWGRVQHSPCYPRWSYTIGGDPCTGYSAATLWELLTAILAPVEKSKDAAPLHFTMLDF